MKSTKIIFVLLLALFTSACLSPNTQPVIDATLEWKKMEDQELAKHRQLLSVAKFDADPVKNVELKAAYAAAIDQHARIADQYANAIVTWAQRVGKFDQEYANKTLEQMIKLYNQIKDAIKEVDQ